MRQIALLQNSTFPLVTLILSCLTSDNAYLVSDRRLTSFDVPRRIVDDDTNKIVLLNGHVALGYTGREMINEDRADVWLAKAVAGVDSRDAAHLGNIIAEKATNAFRKMSFASRYKRHAFQAVGWFPDPSGGPVRVGKLLVYNALDNKSGKWLPYAKTNFEVSAQVGYLGSSHFRLSVVGSALTAEEGSAIYRLVKKCVHRRINRERAILQAMVMGIRWASTRYEAPSPIGTGLLAAIIPHAPARSAIERGEWNGIAGHPSPNILTFLDLPSTGRAESHGPHFVGGSMIGLDFRAGSIL